MREPPFWWRLAGPHGRLLSPLAAVYGAVVASRMARSGALPACRSSASAIRRWAAPVRRRLRLRWRRILTRPGGVRSCSAAAMAAGLRARCGRSHAASRGRSRRRAAAAGALTPTSWRATAWPGRTRRMRPAPAIVMDDGFQNPGLAKGSFGRSWSMAGRGIGNGRVFPPARCGRRCNAQLSRAQAVLVVGPGRRASGLRRCARQGLAVFHGRLVPDAAAIAG